eukprot:1244202-Rhodomonas_salina.1
MLGRTAMMGISIRSCYAMSGTDLYDAVCPLSSYATSDADILRRVMVISVCSCYAMSRIDSAYGACQIRPHASYAYLPSFDSLGYPNLLHPCSASTISLLCTAWYSSSTCYNQLQY